jgi:hypothetical protein
VEAPLLGLPQELQALLQELGRAYSLLQSSKKPLEKCHLMRADIFSQLSP